MFLTEKLTRRKRIMILVLSILMSVVAICWYTVSKLHKEKRDTGAIFVESNETNNGGSLFYEKT